MAITITTNPTVVGTSSTTPVVVTGAGGTTWLTTPPTFTISGTGNSTGTVTVASNTSATVQVKLAAATGGFTLTDTLDSATATLTGIVVALPVVISNMPQFATVAVNAANLNDIVAGVPGYFITVYAYTLVPPAATAVTVAFYSHTAGAISGIMPIGGASGLLGLSSSSRNGLFQTAAGEALALNLGGATLVSGHLTYALTKSS
jgi:hypothetical protein